jgi:hypothetical protein
MSVLQIRQDGGPVVADASGRPIQVIVTDRPVAVDVIEAVREEVAAYPVATGPRTLFTVRVAGARVRLIHQHRDGRWTVDIMSSERPSLASAA